VKVNAPHDWDVSPSEAAAIQQRLRGRIIAEGDPEAVRFVAGVDISVGAEDRGGLAAVVVIEYPSLRTVEQSVVSAQVTFPYVPGLLSFREIPVLIPAFEQLRTTPDLVVVDGQGMAHPRRFGLASHLGLLLGVPTIGCAKSRLTGAYVMPDVEKGAVSPLTVGAEAVGTVLRTRTGVSPVFVSVGHLIGLAPATDWVLRLVRGLRLPEPTRLAHRAAAGETVTA